MGTRLLLDIAALLRQCMWRHFLARAQCQHNSADTANLCVDQAFNRWPCQRSLVAAALVNHSCLISTFFFLLILWVFACLITVGNNRWTGTNSAHFESDLGANVCLPYLWRARVRTRMYTVWPIIIKYSTHTWRTQSCVKWFLCFL